jgi:hypothetical protein
VSTAPVRLSGFAALLVATTLASGAARAQLWVPAKGEGAVAMTYQYVGDHYHLWGKGEKVDGGRIVGESMQLRLDYGVTPRLAVSLTAPFVRKRYHGPTAHDPDQIHDDHEHATVLDDGDFHGGWQDPAIGLRWRLRDRPWAITPFATYSWPSHDYTYFAHSAIGTRQKKLALGIFVGRQFGPRFQRLYAQGSYSYTFVEEVQDIPVDFSTLTGEVGYFFTPRLSARAFAIYRKTHGGLDFPYDFPSRTDELFFNHDRVQRVDYLNYGFGVGYRLNDHWSVNGNWMTTGWGENGHAIHNAWTVGISRSF